MSEVKNSAIKVVWKQYNKTLIIYKHRPLQKIILSKDVFQRSLIITLSFLNER